MRLLDTSRLFLYQFAGFKQMKYELKVEDDADC